MSTIEPELHPPPSPLPREALLAGLKAAGEETRLRMLALLAEGELSVKDLTAILGQSQPRISRHLKLLAEAGLIDRYPEGAWVFYRLADRHRSAAAVKRPARPARSGDGRLAADRERLAAMRDGAGQDRAPYFAENAARWDTIRALHVAEDAVEAAMLEAVGEQARQPARSRHRHRPDARVARAALCAPSASTRPRHARGRARQSRPCRHRPREVRHGDIYALPLPRDAFDLVTIHQVLHYLDDPERALGEAARALRPAAGC